MTNFNFDDASKIYPEISNLIAACLGQDHEYFGDTLEQIIDYYVGHSSDGEISGLRDETARLLVKRELDLDELFDQAYGADFDPKLWGTTPQHFLRQIERKVMQNL